MNRKISPLEYQELLTFCKKKGVDYLDLRLEVADHLANAIEHRWQNEPNESFDTALSQEYKKFGIFGFTDVVQEYANRMTTKYGMLFLRELKSAFSFKVSIAFLMAMWMLWQLITRVPQSHTFIQYASWTFLMATPLGLTIKYFQTKRMFKGEQLLLLNSPYQYSLWFNYFFIYGGYKIFEADKMMRVWRPEIITLVIFIGAIFYWISFKLQKKSKQEGLLIKQKVDALQSV